MVTEDLYGERKKKKNLYSTYNTATPRAQSTLQSNRRSTSQSSGWSAGQSAARAQGVPQSDAVPKPKREKSPSELGEEVVRTMLEDFKEEERKKQAAAERQRQAAADRAAQYGSGTAGKRATGSKKASLYSTAATAPYTGNAANQFGGAASYGSPSAAKPAAGNQKAAPYGGAAAAQYNRPAAAESAVHKREKTPSELGDEVVARVLVEEGIMDPKDLEEYLASFEEPSEEPTAQALANAGLDENAIRGAQMKNDFANAKQWLSEYTDPIRATPEWQAQAAAQDLAYAGLDGNALKGLGYGDSLFQLDQRANAIRATPDWQAQMSMSDPDHPGLTEFANQVGPWLWDQAKQLVEDTHIAEGLSTPLYWVDRTVNGGEMALEGIWNYGIDLLEAGTNFALEQRKQQAQQRATRSGPYQDHVNSILNDIQLAQEALPELAEFFRRHEAAKHLQEIEEMYDAGGLIKIGGDTASSVGQLGIAGTIGVLTGKGGGLIALGASAAGNAAEEARAGGADDKTAFRYGNLVGLVQVGTELWFGGIPGLPKGLLDNMLANIPQTNMGRLAWKSVQDALGEGAEEFIGTMAEAYLARIWNGDERGTWQTFKETFPNALYAAFQGAMTSTIMCAPDNISNIQYARALDAAIGVLNNGGTLTDAEMAAANASRQYLTDSWGEGSAWSRAANQQWESARNRNFNIFFPPLPNNMTENSTARDGTVEGEISTDSANPNAEQNTNLQTEEGAKNESSQETPKFSTEKTYIDDNPATHTEEQMQRIEEYKQAVDPEIIDFIELVRESPANKKKNLPLGGVTSQQAQRIMEITGTDVTDFTHIMRPDTIRHIDNRHGVFGEADHSMANNEDIARIRYVIENADSIDLVYDKNGKQVFSWEIRNSDNTPAPFIQYSKALDGVCYVIQAVADSKAKKLRIVSAYIGPKQSVPPDEASA